MDNEQRVAMECDIVARCLFGSSALEFYRRLPVICNWLEDIPEGHLRKLAADCSWATDEEALVGLLRGPRADPAGRFRVFTESLQRADWGPGRAVLVRTALDFAADAGYIGLEAREDPDRTATRTLALTDRVNLDYDAAGNVIGIEILGVS